MEQTETPVKKQTPWIGYIIMALIVIIIFKTCSSSTNEDTTTATYEYKPTSGIGYRFLKKRSSHGRYDTPWKDYLYRSYAYEITNFDKNNPYCWQDLYDLGEAVANKTDKDEKLMTTMVYFFLPSDSLRLQDENNWDMIWDDSQDTLWIGNYIWFAGNGHKELIKGVNYR